MKKISIICCLFSASLIFADTVEKVEFEGLDRVEPAALEECIQIKPRQNYTATDIDNTLKALFDKGFFSDIKFIKKGNTLVINCVEKPMVDKVAFEGNDAASDDMLKHIVKGRVGEGRLFSLHVVKDILSDFQMAYKTLGYCSAKITPKVIKHPGNRIDLVFEIVEGSKTTVKKILLVGNKTFNDDELKDLLSTKEAKIWRFWDYESHVFREDKIDVDIENLTEFYKNNGFPFFMVTSAVAEMDVDKKSHYCTFSMEEGDRYTIKDVDLESKVEKIKADDFKKHIALVKGSLYNEALINENKEMIRGKIALKDFPFSDVAVDVSYDKKEKTASVKYIIMERPRVFIERIDVVGNVRTLDRVVRREFSVHEGDAYNVYKIQATIERLKAMGYFDDVQATDSQGATEDKVVLTVEVKEKESTANFRFGLNVSDADGFGGVVGVTENNLMGTGRILSAEIFWMQKQYGFKANIFDPHFMNKDFGAGLSFGAHQSNRKNVDRSVTRSLYASPYIRYAITNRLSQRIGYTIAYHNKRWWNANENILYDKIPENKIRGVYLLKDEYGKFVSSEVSSVLHYDMSDNPYEPRRGYDASLTNTYSGIGGSVRFLRNEVEGNYYYPLTKKVTFITHANIGHLKEISGTRSFNRYALGGDGESMRGFDSYGIGPRDLNNSSLGGDKFWTLSFMMKAPLSSREIGVDGKVFLDFGSAWGSKFDSKYVKESNSVRCSIGVAIEWARSPLGVPLSFVFGFPLRKTEQDEKQTFTLTGFM
ncbi:MAG: outer membrane protein assembly factor BamA [Holosporaceae bacterium]|jgi:outer membrane protein insertion porin family|nr:outer membrane protein assembly factor BamA [Holosporaceae bacterium]